MANNPEIRAAESKVAVTRPAMPEPARWTIPWGCIELGTPLQKPWDWNQSQQMFMYQQTPAGTGQARSRSEVANRQIVEDESQVDVVRREIGLRVRKPITTCCVLPTSTGSTMSRCN